MSNFTNEQTIRNFNSFNGSIMLRTMETCSRHGYFAPIMVPGHEANGYNLLFDLLYNNGLFSLESRR